MSLGMDNSSAGDGGLLANKILWICVGLAFFLIIGYVVPTPQSLINTVRDNGFADKMIEWHIAKDVEEAAGKTMLVLGIIPMAIIFFATEAIPIGLTGILMPIGPTALWFRFLSCVSVCLLSVHLFRRMPCVHL
jgi:sodium-dependent dicarboxylate transporter 2/3/5